MMHLLIHNSIIAGAVILRTASTLQTRVLPGELARDNAIGVDFGEESEFDGRGSEGSRGIVAHLDCKSRVCDQVCRTDPWVNALDNQGAVPADEQAHRRDNTIDIARRSN